MEPSEGITLEPATSEKVTMKKRKLSETGRPSPCYPLPGFFSGPVPKPVFKISGSISSPSPQRKVPQVFEAALPIPLPCPCPSIPNAMTAEFRSKKFHLTRKSEAVYQAIQMQTDHEREDNKAKPEVHHIRKKQSSAKIKRCCGVTYIKRTESRQEGVREQFSPLPPLAIQIGTIGRVVPPSEKLLYSGLANGLLRQLFDQNGLIRATFHSNYGELQMKQYLLGELAEGEEVFLGTLSALWRLLRRDSFVALHFDRDESALLSPALPGRKGQVILGFLVKKGVCGGKSVRTSLGLPHSENDSLNMNTEQIRLELYTSRRDWARATPHTQKLLCALISEFEEKIRGLLPEWNSMRERAFEEGTAPYSLGLHRWIKNCPCPVGPISRLSTTSWSHSSSITGILAKYCLCCQCYTVEPYCPAEPLLKPSKRPPLPYYLLNTRDSFSYDLKVKKTEFSVNAKKVTKKQYFFHKDELPSNFADWESHREGNYVRVGVTTYTGLFSAQELADLERRVGNTEGDFRRGRFIASTAQPSHGTGGQPKRTKFFFGSRYMWTACQLAEKQSEVAVGVRVDVSAAPKWIRKHVEQPLVAAGVLPEGFVNSIAMNIYHDGKEGLAQHFDDAMRFKQPIFTVKLGSDSRLSFGSQLYGYLNGAFTIPCPRGVLCVLEEFGYAANYVKHCVRPCDLGGRSVTLILRQIHPDRMEEAEKYDIEVDLPTWFSCLSLSDDSVPFHKQKENEAKELVKK